MARFSVLVFALVMVFSSAEGWGQDKTGRFTTLNNSPCGTYLYAYSKSTLTGDGGQIGLLETGRSLMRIGLMTPNDARRWIASWCGHNPFKTVYQALDALTNELIK